MFARHLMKDLFGTPSLLLDNPVRKVNVKGNQRDNAKGPTHVKKMGCKKHPIFYFCISL